MRWPWPLLAALCACAPDPIELSIHADPSRRSALLVLQREGERLEESRAFATPIAELSAIPAGTLRDADGLDVYVALYDQTLAELGLPSGELTLATAREPHFAWPRAPETLHAEVTARADARVELIALASSPLDTLLIGAPCPTGELVIDREAVRLPTPCPFQPRARPEVCYGAPRLLEGMPRDARPSGVVIEDGARWLYLSARRADTPDLGRVYRMRLGADGLPELTTLEELPLPDPGDDAVIGVLHAPFVRADGLELFAAHRYRGGPTAASDGRLVVSSRRSRSEPWPEMIDLADLAMSGDDLTHPFLLPDLRTLAFRNGRLSRLVFAARPSSGAGDAAFVTTGQVVFDDDGSGLIGATLSCDRGHVLFATRTAEALELRSAELLALDPPQFEPFRALAIPHVPLSTTLTLAESPACDGLYLGHDLGAMAALPVACGTCGNGILEAGEQCDTRELGGATCASATGDATSRGAVACGADCRFDLRRCAVCGDGVRAGIEACDGPDLGGATCEVVAPGATGTLSCGRSCGFDTRSCTPSFANGDRSGLEPGAPWPMFRGGPAHTAQTSVVGPSVLRERWTFATPSATPGGIVVSARGRVIFPTSAGELIALEASGTLAWRTRLGSEMWGTPAIGRDGRIYIMARDGALRAVSPEGELVWRYGGGFSHQVRGSPTIAPDGTIYHPFPDGTLRAISPQGTLVWSVSLGSGGYYAAGASPALAADGTLYAPAISDQSDALFAVSAAGRVLWRVANRARALEVSAVVTPDGTILYDGRRISPAGEILGETAAGPWGVTLGVGGIVFAGGSGSLGAYTLDGQARWTVYVGTSGPPPPVAAGHGFAYGVGWGAGAAYLVAPNGQLLDRDTSCNALDAPAMGADGSLYAQCDGGVRAFAR